MFTERKQQLVICEDCIRYVARPRDAGLQVTRFDPHHHLLVDEGKAVDVLYLDFSKTLDSVSHSIHKEKSTVNGLDGCTLC